MRPTPLDPRTPTPRSAAAGDDCRCECGSLLARVVRGAVELKCRRCKRTVWVPLVGPADLHSEARGPAPSAQHAGAADALAPRGDAGRCLSCSSSSAS